MSPKSRNARTAYENDEILIYDTAQGLKIRHKREWRWRLIQKTAIAVGLLGAIGCGGAWWVRSQVHLPQVTPSEDFRLAVNRAIAAAELTQTASTYQEWATIAAWWQEAAERMGVVPNSHRQHALAQAKVQEYNQNRQYALSKAAMESTQMTTPTTGLWGLGASRGQLLAVQGPPDRQMDYGTQCREVLYYHNSRVELQRGLVTNYDNVDKNLRVADQVTIASPPDANTWDLTSSQEEVLKVQGTPTQVLHYDSIHQTTVYYGRSYVEFKHGQVLSYHNVENNLAVKLSPQLLLTPAPTVWHLNSAQDTVLQIQGTPTQVTQDPILCRERYYYGNSFVEFRNGHLQSYDNLDRNLKVE